MIRMPINQRMTHLILRLNILSEFIDDVLPIFFIYECGINRGPRVQIVCIAIFV